MEPFNRRRFLQSLPALGLAGAQLSAGSSTSAEKPAGVSGADEVFHGYNPSEARQPSNEVLRVDTRMHSAHAAHGDFQLDYADTVLCAANDRLWADWAVTGIREDTLVALPYIGWFSQRHRLALKFGWWEASILVGRTPLRPYRVTSWYEASAVPTSEFQGGGWRVRSWCVAMPGESRLLQYLRLTPAEGANRWRRLTLVLRGGTSLGEEAGSPFDPVNGTVGTRQPLPSRLQAEIRERQLLVRNAPAGLFARLCCPQPIRGDFQTRELTISGRGQSMTKQYLQFELECPLEVPAQGDLTVCAELLLADSEPAATAVSAPPSVEAACAAWRHDWACLETLATPDPLLTAGLKRSAIYAQAMLPTIDAAQEAAGLSDHVEWPVDCARDCFHVASAMLLLKPELARRHLAFYFLDAIPRSGPGKSYVPTGESRGHREARLLDLASYPLWELWRYWRATGDDAFVARPRVRQTVLEMVDQVASWRDPRTDMFTSTERSSDERCVYPLFVPGNAMFVTVLERMAEIARELWRDDAAAGRMSGLAERARRGILHHATVDDARFGRMFAFEVGGPGQVLLYDQADMPNLLSLPRFGFCRPDDPVYRNTVRFAYSERNQGYRGTADGKYRQLCDGSKTMPFSPWPLGALGQLMSGAVSPAEAAHLLDWLRDAFTPALQLPEISDKHTARPVQRYWFGWPTAALLIAYLETICGVKIDRGIRIEPLIPRGWSDFSSPTLRVRGQELQIVVRQGRKTILLNGRPRTLPEGGQLFP